MSSDTFIRLTEAFVRLIGVLIWPAIVVFVVLRFSRSITEFFSSLGEFTLKAAGFEATARVKAEAAAALTAAAATRTDAATSPEAIAQEAKATAKVVAEAVAPSVIRRAGRSAVRGSMIGQTTTCTNANQWRLWVLISFCRLQQRMLLRNQTIEPLTQSSRTWGGHLIRRLGIPCWISFEPTETEHHLSFMPVLVQPSIGKRPNAMALLDAQTDRMNCLNWSCVP